MKRFFFKKPIDSRSTYKPSAQEYQNLASKLMIDTLSISEKEFIAEYQLVTNLAPSMQSILFMNDIYLIIHKETGKRILLVHYFDRIDIAKIAEEIKFDEIGFADEKTMDLFIQKHNTIGKEINEDVGASDYFIALLTKARVSNVSDIHISLFERDLIIEFSNSIGKFEVARFGIKEASILRNTLEFFSNKNLGEAWYDSKIIIDSYEYRITFIESTQGYSATIRTYNSSDFGGNELTLERLGYTPKAIKLIENICSNQNGCVIYTAPTGQGKTTTEYANLIWLQKKGLKIMAVESPVEQKLYRVHQVDLTKYESADDQFKLTAQMAIKFFLRHKPDVINMGEIRDGDDALLAYTAATTGHLVLCTLHTNSVYTAFMRLTKETRLSLSDVKAIVRGIVYQLLTRQLCPHCKTKTDDKGHYTVNKKGCSSCNNGYASLRTPIVEAAKFPLSRDYEIDDVGDYEEYISFAESAEEKYDMGLITREDCEDLKAGRRVGTTSDMLEQTGESHGA